MLFNSSTRDGLILKRGIFSTPIGDVSNVSNVSRYVLASSYCASYFPCFNYHVNQEVSLRIYANQTTSCESIIVIVIVRNRE